MGCALATIYFSAKLEKSYYCGYYEKHEESILLIVSLVDCVQHSIIFEHRNCI